MLLKNQIENKQIKTRKKQPYMQTSQAIFIINHNHVTTQTDSLVSVYQRLYPKIVVRATFRIQTLGNIYNYIKTKLLINSLGKEVNQTIYRKYFCQKRPSRDAPENRRSQKTKVLKH